MSGVPEVSRGLGLRRDAIGGAQQPGFQRAVAVTRAARAKPGEWLDLTTALTQGSAHSKVFAIRKRPSSAYHPLGAFEARSQRRGDTWAVQVRYVGEPS